MPLTDKNLLLASNLLLSSLSVGNNYAANSVDLLTARDMGQGRQLYLCCDVLVTAASSGGGTIGLQLVGATGVSGAGVVNAGIDTLLSMPLATAALIAGARFAIPIPPQLVDRDTGKPTNGLRYLSANPFVSTAVFQSGAFRLYFGDNAPDGLKFYPHGYSF